MSAVDLTRVPPCQRQWAYQMLVSRMKITLKDLIKSLREEMLEAHKSVNPETGALFILEDAEIEVAVEYSAEVHGKIDFVVAEVGSDISGKRATTIKVKLKEYFPELHGHDQGRLFFQHLRNVSNDPASQKFGQTIEEGRVNPPLGEGEAP